MRLRSLLFVPGDRPERVGKAVASGADALILDLEDSVSPAAKPTARAACAELLAGPRETPLLVRINPLDAPFAEDDLAAILANPPDAIVLPKASPAQAATLASRAQGAPILPIAVETPAAVFGLSGFAELGERLCGLTWGAEDLAAGVGAVRSRGDDGGFTAPFQLARSLTLFAAHSAGARAIETVFADFRDLQGLVEQAGRARRDGFSGMLAIHPAQVPVINDAFTPSAAEIEHAQAVVAAFAAAPGAGVLNLNGRMIDAPHLQLARRLLAQQPPRGR